MGTTCSKQSALKDLHIVRDRIGGSHGRLAESQGHHRSSKMQSSSRKKKRVSCDDIGVLLADHRVEKNSKDKFNAAAAAAVNSIRNAIENPISIEADLLAAGWPLWLVSAAGEAIHGLVPCSVDSFIKLQKIGEGTYSSVYKARDIARKKIVAMKRVRFNSLDPESVKFMSREILLLRRLDHPNVIKLEGLVASRTSRSLYLVFEYMEYDLAGLASRREVKLTESQIKCYMCQLLCGLEHCHNRGILHRDIKGSNLLINSNGILKIADFGLASIFYPNNDYPMTSCVVTLWYRAPELLLGAFYYGVAVDLWSIGCLLGELYAGKPIMPGRTEVEQLHKIFKLCGSPTDDFWRRAKIPRSKVIKNQQPYRQCLRETFKSFPLCVIELMSVFLSLDPSKRGTASSALQSNFFMTKPHACDPSNLPKYAPKKEMDSKSQEASRCKGADIDGSVIIPCCKKNTSFFTRNPDSRSIRSKGHMLNLHKGNDISSSLLNPLYQRLDADVSGRDTLWKLQKRSSCSGCVEKEVKLVNTNVKYDLPRPRLSMSSKLSSNNIDQLIEEYDQKIQEDIIRARLNHKKFEKIMLLSEYPRI